MNKKKTGSRSGIFLTEIMVAILFFALISAICLKIFAESRQLSSDAGNLNDAVAAAITVSEAFQNADNPADAVKSMEKSFDKINADENHGEIPLGDTALLLTYDVAPSKEVPGITCIWIEVKDGDEAVYRLTREVYYGEEI
ncbi:MAG: hypothetical protein PUB87_05955 [Eubacteriaceae bacterium]|nr:hypothetical protein [Eubacteriaceae bacterium]